MKSIGTEQDIKEHSSWKSQVTHHRIQVQQGSDARRRIRIVRVTQLPSVTRTATYDTGREDALDYTWFYAAYIILPQIDDV